MGRTNEMMDKKFEVLRLIYEHKDTLFNPKVSKLLKEEIWTLVLQTAQSLGLTSGERTWMYARDNLYGLWKSRTLAHKARMEQKQAPTNTKHQWDEVDEMMMSIINDTAIYQSGYKKTDKSVSALNNSKAKTDDVMPFEMLEIKHEMDEDDAEIVKEELPESHTTNNVFEQQEQEVNHRPNSVCQLQGQEVNASNQNNKKDMRKRRRISNSLSATIETYDDVDEHATDDELKRLKCELYAVEIYQRKLECLLLERQLNLLPSEFTSNLVRN